MSDQSKTDMIEYSAADVGRELVVANFYLFKYRERIGESGLTGSDFQAVPRLRYAWDSAEKSEVGGVAWTPNTIFDKSDWIPPREGGQSLVDRVVEASSYYSGQSVDDERRRMLEMSVMHATVIDMRTTMRGLSKFTSNTDALMWQLETMLNRVRRIRTDQLIPHSEAVRKAGDKYLADTESGTPSTYPMPTQTLQDAVKGWVPEKLHMIQAPTSGHKTTLLRSSIEHVARDSTKAGYITLEDSTSELVARSLSAGSRKFTTRDMLIGNKDATAPIVEAVAKSISEDLPIVYCHAPHNRSQIIARIHELAAAGCKVIGVDFFQLISRVAGDRSSEAEFWGGVALDLQRAALQTGSAIICCVQPTADATRDSRKTGRMLNEGDIRGGAAIGQALFALLTLGVPRDDSGKVVPGKIIIAVDKWKTSLAKGRLLPHGLEPQYDRIFDLEPQDPAQAKAAAGITDDLGAGLDALSGSNDDW